MALPTPKQLEYFEQMATKGCQTMADLAVACRALQAKKGALGIPWSAEYLESVWQAGLAKLAAHKSLVDAIYAAIGTGKVDSLIPKEKEAIA